MSVDEPRRPDDDEPDVVVPDDLSSLFADHPDDVTPGAVNPGAATPGPATPDDARASVGDAAAGADDDLVVPDDLSALSGGAGAAAPTVAVLLTQVAGADPLAALCSLAGVDADAVATPVGAIAVLREPRGSREAAPAVSTAMRGVPLVLLERREGQVTATRWQDGALQDELPSGLVLSGAPDVLEDLLIGGVPVSEVGGAVASTGISRWKAMRMLASRGRRPRD